MVIPTQTQPMTNYNTVYESPDGGQTVYSRGMGSVTQQLVRSNTRSLAHSEMQIWYDILLAAKENPALEELLDKARTFYFLTKNEN